MTVSGSKLLAPAALLEGLAALAVARGVPAVGLALHAAASGLVARWLDGRLLARGSRGSFSFPFAWAFLVPVLGSAGLVAVAALLPWLARAEEPEETFTRTPISLQATSRAEPGPVPARKVRSSLDERLAELAAAGKRGDPVSVGLLRRALSDWNEEVRLLAFSLLEARTAEAYRRIAALARDVAGAGGARGAALHAQLAFEHWELARLGLVQGEVLVHEIQAAEEHVRSALEHDPRSPSAHFLLARIQLRRGQTQEALASLVRAGEAGLPEAVRAPYLAEVAFRERRFDLVRMHLARPGGGAGAQAKLRRYWL